MKVTLLGPANAADILLRRDVPVGLGGTVTNELARSLTAIGMTVTVVTGAEDITAVWDSGVESCPRVICVPFRKGDKRRLLTLYSQEIRSLRSVIKQLDADVLHAQWAYEYALAALSVNRRAVVTVRDSPVTQLFAQRSLGTLARLLMAIPVRLWASGLTANSTYAANLWKHEMLDSRSIRVVPNPVSIPPGLEEQLQPVDRREVSTFGLISSSLNVKNNEVLFRAWPRIREKMPQATLMIAGHTITEDYIKNRVGNVPAGITLLGNLNRVDLFHYIRDLDVLIHPSKSETFGNAVVEAMSQGVPVIGNKDCETVVNLFVDGSCGFVIEMNNERNLADEVVRIVSDEATLREVGDRGKAHVLTRFNGTTIARRWQRIYREIENLPSHSPI